MPLTQARASRRPAIVQLTELDHQLLELVSRLRVVTQTQIERLYADVPGRTLRYRSRRLHRLGLLGRTRPYRDRGSAPHHYWPTHRADAVVRAEPFPRRGERGEPSPLFLAHTAAVSELYVVLCLQAEDADLTLVDFRREGEARQAFTDLSGRPRAIAPDARITLEHGRGRQLIGHVELDLGTMSHARLRKKLDGYFAHAQRECHQAGGAPLAALLFITTSTLRADAFLRTARTQRANWTGSGAHDLPVVACSRAHRLDDLFTLRCWRQTDGGEAMTLAECMRASP